MLINDQYTIRLTVFDRGGNTQQASVNVQVARDMKVGNFSLTFTDLNVPMSGLPIVVNRIYDSRDKRKGDFGIGWRLSVQTMRIRTNRILGTGWVRNQAGAVITLSATDGHKVSVTLPNGRVEEFDMQVSPTSGLGSLDFTNVTGFTPRAGTVGKLETLAENSLAILNAGVLDELVDINTLNTYNPQLYRYTSLDGTEFVVHKTNGVQSIKETNGNTLTFGPNGIIHSAGKSALFQRDSEGRIIQLTDPRGNIQTYAYDVNGDLIRHTDPAGSSTDFSYNRRHDLLRMIDPIGRAVTRNEYDEAGRLIASVDAKGNRIAFSHDIPGRQEVVTDRLGRATFYDYDDQGNVLRITNPLGQTINYSYDSRGNKLTATNSLGHTTTYGYDANNNLMSLTDPLGHTTTYTYNSHGQTLTITDPNGHSGTGVYDAKGNLTTQTDPLGHTTKTAYDSAGNRLTITDPLGRDAQNQYDAFGNRTKLTQPAGNVVTMSYDNNGNLLSQSSAGINQNLTYNVVNRITSLAIGSMNRQIIYDAAGQPAQVTAPGGQQVQVAYDSVGLPMQISQIGTNAVLGRTYDAEGNVLTEVDLAGNVTRYSYDGANRLGMTTFPDGSSERYVRDAVGQIVQVIDRLGRTTSFAYDAAGRQIGITDALGNSIIFAYDAVGNKVAETDPQGRLTQYIYDSSNRLVRTKFSDGTEEQRAYDATGNLVQQTDGAGRATSFDYDALSRLVAVTDASGNTARYEYDGAGRRSAIVDANGGRTTFSYDAQGRLAAKTYPAGGTESFTYDTAGRLNSTTNGNGETLQYFYDAVGRLNHLVVPGGTQEAYAYTVDGLISTVADARGTTTFSYDALTRRLIRVTEPDGRYIRYGYDVLGNRTLMAHAVSSGSPEEISQYAYDALNRLIQTTDPIGGITTYTYDPSGNQTSIARPNGTTTSFTYDSRNRLTSVVHKDSANATLASFVYTLDGMGNRKQIQHFDGSRVEYDYDATSKVIAERHFDSGNVMLANTTYSYDAVGNLVTRTGSLGNATYTYNANNQITAGDGITYAYDAAGNLTSKTESATAITRYSWDARGRLVQFQPPTGTATTYAYDFRGVRQSKNGPSGLTNFLIDRTNATGFEQVIRETTTAGVTIRSYIYGSDLLARLQNGSVSYYHIDGLGSTRLTTTSTGAVSDQYSYSAYGSLLPPSGSLGNSYLFAGEQRDEESALYYLRARYYDPAISRFLSGDPLDGDQSIPLSLNKYLYAYGNPVNLTDPSGLFTLAELQTVISNYFTQFRPQLVRFQRAKEKAEEALGESAKIAGGLMIGTAVLETFNDLLRPLRWFGPNPLRAIRGLWNSAEVAFDMLGGKDIEFDIGIASASCATRPWIYASVDHKKIQFRRGLGAGANKAWIDLCMRFFGSPPMPLAAEGVYGTPSMAGIMIHEMTHITLNTGDQEYGCAPIAGQLGPTGGTIGLLGPPMLSGEGLKNADNYRCFARDAWLRMGDRLF
jgi:RHS repeat-associated protein